MALALLLVLGAGPVQAQSHEAQSPAPAQTGTAQRLDLETRVDALLARMTLDEKIGQLNLVSHGPTLDWSDIATGRAGALINFNNAQDIARAQRLARETRLGIPLLFGLDVLHGFRTQFPMPLAQAASFDPDLARSTAAWAAREAAFVGVNWTYAPMVDLSRDPRWGRIVEGFGEDPHLSAVMARARVEGFHAGGIAATAKHFVGYGAPEGGRDYDTTPITPSDLHNLYLPPFRAAVEAGAEAVMAAFNVIDGLPSMANPHLLTEVLRRRWGFDGIVTSDWAGILELVGHGIAADGAEAARKAFLAGVDMDMMGGFYIRHLAEEVRAGRVPEARVDEAVRRVLRVKVRMGLFERPSIDERRVDAIFPTPESRGAARAAAQETTVLLRNWDDLLPIGPAVRSIVVVGPFADAPGEQFGPHGARSHPQDSVSILAGLRRRASEAGISVTHAPGCAYACSRLEGLDEALAAARDADLVIAVMGESLQESGEAASRAHLALSGRQPELLAALIAAGRPVALVLMGGRPLELGRLAERLPAILMAWFPGTQGDAIADILFGDANPSAKLPVSWPRAVGQLPMAYNRLPTGRPAAPDNRYTVGYMDEGAGPLFPFGHGLSYTRFAYSGLAVSKAQASGSEAIEASVVVRNEGPRASREVVQLYARDPVASRSRPVRELKAFAKIHLEPGEARRVTFKLPVRSFGFHLEDGTFVVESGEIRLFAGGDSLARLETRLDVTDELRVPPGAAGP